MKRKLESVYERYFFVYNSFADNESNLSFLEMKLWFKETKV